MRSASEMNRQTHHGPEVVAAGVAAQIVRQMLSAHPDIEVAGEAGTGVEAMEMAASLRPDVILLDIQMPGSSGLDVAACLPKPRPHVVFCTAFDQYAVEAFELHAVDYLLKPVGRARLAQTLDRIRTLPGNAAREEALDQAIRRHPAGPARFLVRNGAHYLVVGEARVLYFGTEGSLTRLVADNGQYWMDPSLNELEQRLDLAKDPSLLCLTLPSLRRAYAPLRSRLRLGCHMFATTCRAATVRERLPEAGFPNSVYPSLWLCGELIFARVILKFRCKISSGFAVRESIT